MRTGSGWSRIPEGAKSAEDEAIRNIEREKRGKEKVPDHVYRNSDAIRHYLEVWPTRVETSLMGSDEPYDRKARGGSRLPTPFSGVLFMFDGDGLGVKAGDESAQALAYLRLTLKDLAESSVRVGGFSFKDIAAALWEDPGAGRRWEESRFAGGTAEDQKTQAAFKKLSLLIAWTLYASFPDAEVTVGSEEKRERAKTRRAQRIDTAMADAAIVEELERIEKSEGPMKRGVAMDLLIERTRSAERPLSGDRIRRAVERHNRRLADDEAESA